MVERFLRDLTENRLNREVFRSVLALIEALDGYVDNHKEEPKPFIWIAKAQDNIAEAMRAWTALNNRRSV